MFSLLINRVVAYAPIPTKAPCPSEMIPVNPVKMLRPIAPIMKMPVILIKFIMYLLLIKGKRSNNMKKHNMLSLTNLV